METDVILVKPDGTELLMGTFTQVGFQQSEEFTITPTEGDQIIQRPRKALSYGSQLELTGSYQPPLPTPYKKPRRPIGWLGGVDLHMWNLTNNDPREIDELKFALFLSLDFYIGSIRMFEDFPQAKDLDGRWRLGTDERGFMKDAVFARLQQERPQLFKYSVLQNQSKQTQLAFAVADPNNYAHASVVDYDDWENYGRLVVNVGVVVGESLEKVSRFHVYINNAYYDTVDVTSGGVKNGNTVYFDAGGMKFTYAQGLAIKLHKSQKSNTSIAFPTTGYRIIKDDYSKYLEYGDAAFVMASRYGKNANVPDYPNVDAPDNLMTKGTGLYQMYELANEPNSYWKGTWEEFYNSKDLHYMMSMICDGHMGAYANKGAKQADPSAVVSTPGLASDRLDIIYGAYYEAIKERGYLPDGRVNLPFDVINIHFYPGGQHTGATGATPPEDSLERQAEEWVWFIENKAPGIGLNIGEIGIDGNPNSALGAPIFGVYTSGKQVSAMWIARIFVLFAKIGVDRMQIFQLFAENASDENSSEQFRSMSLATEINSTTFVRNIVGDYCKQVMEFRDYVFDSVIATGNAAVRCYKFKHGTKEIIFLWSKETVSIVNGVRACTELIGNFSVPVPNNANLAIRTLVDNGSGVMSTSNVTAVGVTHSVEYRSRLKVIQILSTNTPPTANAGTNRTTSTSSVGLYGSGTDGDGTIASYAWSQVSGPSNGIFATPNSQNTLVTGLINTGTYVFRLTVTDNLGSTATSTVTITRNVTPTLTARQRQSTVQSSSGGTSPALIYLPDTYDTDPLSTTYPLIIFLHGLGQKSATANYPLLAETGLPEVIGQGLNPEYNGNKYIVVSPQHHASSHNISTLPYILDDIQARFRTNVNRVYIIGLSAGAEGAVSAVTNDPAFAARIAAIIPIAMPGMANGVTQANIPLIGNPRGVKMWAIIGANDFYKSAGHDPLVAAYNSTTPVPLATNTIIDGAGHDENAWNESMKLSFAQHANNQTDMHPYEWLYQWSR